MLLEAVVGEVRKSEPSTAEMLPDEVVTRFMDEIRNLNRGYREEFRAGVGDEVAFAMDFKGEMPRVPGVSEETAANSKIPRFLVARPVADRAKIDAAGKSFAASMRSLTDWANELSGEEYPLLLPQQLKSDGLETWYPPVPFIGGDFVPGVSMNDKVWMLGTSKEFAEGFAKSMVTPASGGETGMIAEIDFAPLWAWTEEMRKLQGANIEDLAMELADEQPEAIREKSRKSLEEVGKSLGRLEGLGYRKWLDDGAPRTSLHLRMAE